MRITSGIVIALSMIDGTFPTNPSTIIVAIHLTHTAWRARRSANTMASALSRGT